jgi:hypothetical protein
MSGQIHFGRQQHGSKAHVWVTSGEVLYSVDGADVV